MSETLLEIRGLTITARSGRKTSTLVEGADLTLRRGEVLVRVAAAAVLVRSAAAVLYCRCSRLPLPRRRRTGEAA